MSAVEEINKGFKRGTNVLSFRNPNRGINDDSGSAAAPTTYSIIEKVRVDSLLPSHKIQLLNDRKDMISAKKEERGRGNAFQNNFTQQEQEEIKAIESEIATNQKMIDDFNAAVPVGSSYNVKTEGNVAAMTTKEEAIKDRAKDKLVKLEQARQQNLQRLRDARSSIQTPQPTNTISSQLTQQAQQPEVNPDNYNEGDAGPRGGTIVIKDGQKYEAIKSEQLDATGRSKSIDDYYDYIPLVTTAAGAIAGSFIPGLGTAAGAIAGMSIGSAIAGYANTKEQQEAIAANQQLTMQAYLENQARLEAAKQFAIAKLEASTDQAEYAINAAQVDALSTLQSGQELSARHINSLNQFINDYSQGNLALAQEVKDTFQVQQKMVDQGLIDANGQLVAGATVAGETLAQGYGAGRETLLEGSRTAQKTITKGMDRAYDLQAVGYDLAQKKLLDTQKESLGDLSTGSTQQQAALNQGFSRGISTLQKGEQAGLKTLQTTREQTLGALQQGFGTAQDVALGANKISQQQLGAGFDESIATLQTALSNSGLSEQQQLDVLNKGPDSPYYTEAVKGFQSFAQAALNPNNEIVQRRIDATVSDLNKQLAARGITGPAAAKITSDAIQKIRDEESTKQIGYQRDLASFGIQQQQISNALNEARAKILSTGQAGKTALLQSVAQAQAEKGTRSAGLTAETAKQVSDYAAQQGISESQAIKELGLSSAEAQLKTAGQISAAQISQSQAISDVLKNYYNNSAELKARLGELGVKMTVDQATALSTNLSEQAKLTGGIQERTATSLATSLSDQAAKEAAQQMTITGQLAANTSRASEVNASNLGSTRQQYAGLLADAMRQELASRQAGVIELSNQANQGGLAAAGIVERGGANLADAYLGAAKAAAGVATETAGAQSGLSERTTNAINQGNLALSQLEGQKGQYLTQAITTPMMTYASMTANQPTVNSATGLSAKDRISSTWNNWTGKSPQLTNSPSLQAEYGPQPSTSPLSSYTPSLDVNPSDYSAGYPNSASPYGNYNPQQGYFDMGVPAKQKSSNAVPSTAQDPKGASGQPLQRMSDGTYRGTGMVTEEGTIGNSLPLWGDRTGVSNIAIRNENPYLNMDYSNAVGPDKNTPAKQKASTAPSISEMFPYNVAQSKAETDKQRQQYLQKQYNF